MFHVKAEGNLVESAGRPDIEFKINKDRWILDVVYAGNDEKV